MTDPDPRAPDLVVPGYENSLYDKLSALKVARGANATIEEQVVEVIAGCIHYGMDRRRPITAKLRAIGFARQEIDRAFDGYDATDSRGGKLYRRKDGSFCMRHPDGQRGR